MTTFEEAGKVIDREVEKLRRFVEGEVKPATERQLVSALRAASKRLGELAEKLEARPGGQARGAAPALRRGSGPAADRKD